MTTATFAASSQSHSTRKARRWQEPAGAGLLLLSLTLLYFWPQLISGKALYWGDIGLYFSPMLQFLHDQLHRGRIPLWNPWILCGAPYVGNPQTWPLYPFSAALLGLSASQFINATAAFHVWLAAFGTYFFLRRAVNLCPTAVVLGAITFGFGGQLVSKEQFPNMVQAAAYLPWILLLTHNLVHRAGTSDALRLGLALGLQLLAAHAQITLLTLYLAAVYGLAQVVTVYKMRRWSPARLIGLALLAGLVAAGLAAGQLLPAAELYHDAWRQRLSYKIVDRFYLPDTQLLNFVLPALHGHPFFGSFTARGNFWETCCYVGVVPFLLAAWGGALSWQRRGVAHAGRFWCGVFIVGLLMALGGQTWRGSPTGNGLYKFAYWVLPGFRNFHDPARCLLWVCFALSVLAAFGLDALWRTRTRRPLVRLACVLGLAFAFLALAYFGRTLYPLADTNSLHPTPLAVAFLQATPDIRTHQARLLAPDTDRTWQRFTAHQSFRQTVPDYLSLWAGALTPNLTMPYALPSAYGYEPVTRLDTQTVTGDANNAFHADSSPEAQARATTWAGLLGVQYVATLRAKPPEHSLPGLIAISSAGTLAPLGAVRDPVRLYLSRNVRWQPRARLMTDYVTAASPKKALAIMSDAMQSKTKAALDLRRTVLIAGPVPFPSYSSPIRAACIVADDTDSVMVEADCVRPSLLVLADTGHPGWSVMVDGQRAPLLSADGCLRAVALPQPGAHQAVFTYRPTSFRLGLYVSLLTTLGLIAFAACRRRNLTENSGGF